MFNNLFEEFLCIFSFNCFKLSILKVENRVEFLLIVWESEKYYWKVFFWIVGSLIIGLSVSF